MTFFCALGQHITLVAHSKAVGTCLDAAKELTSSGIDCEVCNFFLVTTRTLKFHKLILYKY